MNRGVKDKPGHAMTVLYFKLVDSLASLMRLRKSLGETNHPDIPGVDKACKIYAVFAVANALNRSIKEGQGTRLDMLRTVAKTCNLDLLPPPLQILVKAHWPDAFETSVVPA